MKSQDLLFLLAFRLLVRCMAAVCIIPAAALGFRAVTELILRDVRSDVNQ